MPTTLTSTNLLSDVNKSSNTNISSAETSERQPSVAPGLPHVDDEIPSEQTPLNSPNSRRKNSFGSSFQSQWITWLLTVLACTSVASTIYFAHNCSHNAPRSQGLIFSKPEKTILTLALLSQLTVFLLGQLINNMFESKRWEFAGSQHGILALNFLALGPSTPSIGVLMILFRALKAVNGKRNSQISGDGYVVWGSIR